MTALQTMTAARARGITPAQLHPLLYIIERSKVCPSRIARGIGVSTAAITGLTCSLEAAGWITRQPVNVDGRRYHFIPTEKTINLLTP